LKESGMNSSSLERKASSVEEMMRLRDLIKQVERFLKYASKGTDPEVLRREAQEFDHRLVRFGNGPNPRIIRKLHRKLREIYEPRVQ